MARIRTIKPEFWTDEKIGKLKREERLCFIGLWNIADDQGVVKANPAYIKGQLFPYDEELRVSTVSEWLSSLLKARMLVPFSYNGESYYIIRTFDEHQLINRPSKPRFPEEEIKKKLQEDNLNTHGVLTEYSQPEGKGNGSSNGKEVEGSVAGARAPTPSKKSFKSLTEEEFKNEIRQANPGMPDKMLYKFFQYWSERSASGLMKFQLGKTWDTRRRLETWRENELKFEKNGAHKQSNGKPVPQAVTSGGFGQL